MNRLASGILIAVAVLMARADADAAGSRQPIRQVVTFGDSWSDAGAFGTIYGTTPGSSWSQLFARTYGDDQTAYLYAAHGEGLKILGGLNFAQGGAKTDSPVVAGSAAESVPHSVGVQIHNYERSFGRFRPDQLIVVWIGFNDIAAPFSSGPPADQQAMSSGKPSATLRAAALLNARKAAKDGARLVRQLLAGGAERIVFLNEPDIGATPFQPDLQPAGLTLATELTAAYNEEVAKALPQDPRILTIDVDTIMRTAPANGIKNVSADGCANKGFSCGPDDYTAKDVPESYLFAGYGHLTRHGRQLIADSVRKLVDARWPD